jgi:hypothetical protein
MNLSAAKLNQNGLFSLYFRVITLPLPPQIIGCKIG